MFSIPIDSGLYYARNCITKDQSTDLVAEVDKLLEGKMINGQRRMNRYGSKAFGSFGPFERSPLPPLFQTILDQFVEQHRSQLESIAGDSKLEWNQVEIIKLSSGTKYFFDIDQEQETQGPQLFINLSGLHPITFYNAKPGVSIQTTLSTTASTTEAPITQPFESTSMIVSPEEYSCLILPQSATKKYAKQIKAQSYKTKAIPIDLTPLTPSSDQPIVDTNLLHDFSLLLHHAKQKHIEKKAKRLQWLQFQQTQGKMTEEEVQEALRKDGLRDATLEQEFNSETSMTPAVASIQSNTLTTDDAQNQPISHGPAADYLLSLNTTSYKRANSYALVFRSFVKHNPIDAEQNVDEANAQTGEFAHVTEKQRKNYIDKQQRANKAVPTLAINLEDMTDEQLAAFEKKHVHSVYDNIADHFSGTRYQAWPQVDEFVQSLPEGTTLADIGCGNGKYLSTNPNIITIGCDISFNLLKLAHDRGCNVAVGDSLAVPLRSNSFDNTISIAVLHHIASRKRRIESINEMLRITRPGGQVLITVWAKEQDGSGGRVFNQGDVWVPFKTSTTVGAELERQKAKRQQQKEEHNKLHRKEITLAGGAVTTAIPTATTAVSATPETTSTTIADSNSVPVEIDAQLPEDVSAESTRFYHVFCQGELEDHVNDPLIAYPMKIDKVFYGKGNWCIIFTRL